MSLSALVKEYLREYAGDLQDELDYYRSLLSLNDAIRDGTLGVGENGKMLNHQHRLGYGLLNSQADVLLEHKEKIRRARTFHELYDLIWSKRLDGVGALACYDAALRIGAYLGLQPSTVYLHSGALAGYRALGLRASGGTADVETLPKPLQSLSPSDLENFLCIYKKKFTSNGRNAIRSCGRRKRPRPRRGRC